MAVFCLGVVLGDSGCLGHRIGLERFQRVPWERAGLPRGWFVWEFRWGSGRFLGCFPRLERMSGDWVGSGGFTVTCVGGADENEAFGLKHTI